MLGPRPSVDDNASFYLDTLGAPSRIVNALGATTLIRRGSQLCPSLVTRVQAPNGRITRVVLDTTSSSCQRGNPKIVYDSVPGGTGDPAGGVERRTEFTYDSPNTKDSPSRITAGTLSQDFTYTTLGLTATATAFGHTTAFTYGTDGSTLSGLVTMVRELGVETWVEQSGTSVVQDQTTQFFYDAKGNLARTINPVGVATTIINGPRGLPDTTYDAYSIKTGYAYDSLNRPARVSRFRNVWAMPDGWTPPLADCDAAQIVCTGGVAPPDVDSTTFPAAINNAMATGLMGNSASSLTRARSRRNSCTMPGAPCGPKARPGRGIV